MFIQSKVENVIMCLQRNREQSPRNVFDLFFITVKFIDTFYVNNFGKKIIVT